ncbi:MAG: aspartate carbamoyltransferase [Patescibacteria group bacterium]
MKLRHIVTAEQFLDRKFLDKLFVLARKMEKTDMRGYTNALRGKILATVFYEPSTRTRFSFESAMMKLGGQVLTTESAGQFSSAVKGETLEDSIRIIEGYADAIVLRHPQTGAARIASDIASVPVINAGDGSGEHPTQALLDLYTIHKEKGSLDNLHISLVGDLLYGRTIHSLLKFFPLYKNLTVSCVSPKKLKLPDEHLQYLKNNNVGVEMQQNMKPVLARSDVLYMTRVQKERFSSLKEYESVKGTYVLDQPMLTSFKKDGIVMHPLPRVNEIAAIVDQDPRALYFKQAKNGLYIRAALLHWVFKGK